MAGGHLQAGTTPAIPLLFWMEEHQGVKMRMEAVGSVRDFQRPDVAPYAQLKPKLLAFSPLPQARPGRGHTINDIGHVIAQGMRNRERDQDNAKAQCLRLLHGVRHLVAASLADLRRTHRARPGHGADLKAMEERAISRHAFENLNFPGRKSPMHALGRAMTLREQPNRRGLESETLGPG